MLKQERTSGGRAGKCEQRIVASPSWPPDVLAAGGGPPLLAKVHTALHSLGGPGALQGERAVRFRPIKPSDRQELESLHAEWFPVQYPPSFYEELCEKGTLKGFAAVSSRPLGKHNKPADNEELLLGAVTFRTRFAQPRPDMQSVVEGGEQACMSGAAAYVVTLGVVDALRGRGIAKELLKRTVAAAQDDLPQLKAIWLHVVSYNDPALALYRQLGFQQVRQFTYFYHFCARPWHSWLLVRYFAGGGPPRSLNFTVAWDEVQVLDMRVREAFKGLLRNGGWRLIEWWRFAERSHVLTCCLEESMVFVRNEAGPVRCGEAFHRPDEPMIRGFDRKRTIDLTSEVLCQAIAPECGA